MRKTAHRSTISEDSLPTSELAKHAQSWLLDGEVRQLSNRTLDARKTLLEKFQWFLQEKKLDTCGKAEIRAFLAYVTNGHQSESGRWGNPRMKKAVRPRTVQTYHTNLETFFSFLVREEEILHSPMETLKRPVYRADQIVPFTRDQMNALLGAAKRSKYPERDTAIVLFLLDTGCRASEVCNLKRSDLDLGGHRCVVHGKGNKSRAVHFQIEARRALFNYLKADPKEDDDFLFASERGSKAGEGLTRSGLRQLIERLGRAAGIEACRCSPHTFRHTFAVEFLCGGGNTFSLMTILGHTSVTMTQKYVALAQADVEAQHRAASPADRLKRPK